MHGAMGVNAVGEALAVLRVLDTDVPCNGSVMLILCCCQAEAVSVQGVSAMGVKAAGEALTRLRGF